MQSFGASLTLGSGGNLVAGSLQGAHKLTSMVHMPSEKNFWGKLSPKALIATVLALGL